MRITKVLLSLIFLMLLSNIASAGVDQLLSPGMGWKWYTAQSADFKEMIVWVLGSLIFVLGLAFVISSGTAAGKGMMDKGGFGNPEDKAKSNNAMFGILMTLIGVMILIAVASGFFKWF